MDGPFYERVEWQRVAEFGRCWKSDVAQHSKGRQRKMKRYKNPDGRHDGSGRGVCTSNTSNS